MITLRPLGYHLKNLVWDGVDLLFPPTCPGCGKFAARWCEECQNSVETFSDSICDVCGKPLSQPGQCPTCRNSRPAYDLMRSWAVFNGALRDALHTLKYKRNFGLGTSLAKQLFPYCQQINWPVDVMVPIPLSPGRYAERGYNQVLLVASPLADKLNLPVRPAALRRVRETRSQVGLNAHERRQNVHQIFQANPRQVQGKHILLMDDVITTGATISDAARALRDAGAVGVYAFSVARAPLEK